MPSPYPGGFDAFTPRIDHVDKVMAAHVNELQDGIEAIEPTLGANPQGSAADVATRLSNAMSLDGTQIEADTLFLNGGYVGGNGITTTGTGDLSMNGDLLIDGTLTVTGGITLTGTSSQYWRVDNTDASATTQDFQFGVVGRFIRWNKGTSRFELSGKTYIPTLLEISSGTGTSALTITSTTTSNNSYGIYILKNGAITGTSYGMYISELNATVNNFGIYTLTSGAGTFSIGISSNSIGTAANSIAIQGTSTATGAQGVGGAFEASGTTTINYGLEAAANSAVTNYGVYSIVTAGTGTPVDQYSGYFSCAGATAAGSNYGVYSTTTSVVGTEVMSSAFYGVVSGTGNNVCAVYGNTTSNGVDSWAGCFQNGSVNSGMAVGVYGSSIGAGVTNYGARGVAANATTNYGGHFESDTAGTTNYGIYATSTAGATNWAGYFNAGNVFITNTTMIGTAITSGKLAIYGSVSGRGIDVNVSTNGDIGLGAQSTGVGVLSNYGVLGSAQGSTTYNIGVSGTDNGGVAGGTNVIGVLGSVTSATGTNVYGGYFTSTGAGAGTNYGIYSIASGATTNYAGYFAGLTNVTVSSGSNALEVISTSSANPASALYLNKSGATANTAYGAYVLTSGSAAINNAGYFDSTGSGTVTHGVYGYAHGAATNARGVIGATDCTGTNSVGVYGTAIGIATSSYGLYGTATGAGTTNYGIYSTATGAGTNWAGYFTGSRVYMDSLTINDNTPPASEKLYVYSAVAAYGLTITADTACGIGLNIATTGENGIMTRGINLTVANTTGGIGSYGIYAEITGTGSSNRGAYLSTTGASSSNMGVVAIVNSGTAINTGIYASVSGKAEKGLDITLGDCNAADVTIYGSLLSVQPTAGPTTNTFGYHATVGSVVSANCYGIYGNANGTLVTTQTNYGVYGTSEQATDNIHYGVYGNAKSVATVSAIGVCGYGEATAASSGTNEIVGVKGTGVSVSTRTPYGVYAIASGGGAPVNSYGLYATNSVVGTSAYGIYASSLGAGTTNYGIYATASGAATNYAGYFGGNVTILEGAASRLYIDATSTPHTDTNGAIDIALTSLTDNIKALGISSTNTAVVGNNAYGISNRLSSNAVVTGTNQTLYGLYNAVTKTGADTNANTTTLYGSYSIASNTGATNAGTKNTYGIYTSATGDTAGTSTTYGIYTTATGADTNYSLYTNDGTNWLNVASGVTLIGTVASAADFTNAQAVISNGDSGVTYSGKTGLAVECFNTGVANVGGYFYSKIDTPGMGLTCVGLQALASQSNGIAGVCAGLYAIAANGNNTAGSNNKGIYASGAAAETNYGIYATSASLASTTNYGVYGDAASGVTNYGGYFTANTAGTTNYGVYATGTGATTNYAGYFVGSTKVEGRLLGYQGADVTAGNDITLGSGNYFDVTGATEVQRILGTGWTAGSIVTLQFDSNPNVKNGTAAGGGYYGFKLAGGGDFATGADDTLMLVFDGAWWREISRTVI